MTQLVGVICENRRDVILVSDRMVTTADGSLAFEHEQKFEFIAPNALVLTAGTIHEPELIADAKQVTQTRVPLRQIAESLGASYRRIRRKRVEHEVLGEMGISSFEDFYARQSDMHENVILDLSTRIQAYDLEVGFLLGGVDEKAHLYSIGEPGTYRSYDELGFCCIGSGDRHAEPVFAFYGYSLGMSRIEALQIAFEAKKRAEMAGGVGQKTDAWIVCEEGIYEIIPETIGKLEEIHGRQETSSRLFQAIEVKTKKLEYPAA